MQGLELNERFYFDVVKKLINKAFPMLENKYAAGLIGYGSDALGNDDELSRDHEWGPRCHIWLSDEDYERYAQAIDDRLLKELPLTYLGYPTRYRWNDEFRALVGADTKENSLHHIAITTVKRHLKIQFGIPKRQGQYYLTDVEWLCMPEQKLLELTRGKIFEDPAREITRIRESFSYYNAEVWKSKILYCWEQISDLEIIPLCFARGDEIGGRICLNRVLEQIIRLTYLYNKKYYPGYMKWFGYEFLRLPILAKEIESPIKACQCATTVDVIMDRLKSILNSLLKVHNALQVTPYVNLESSKTGRGLCDISVRPICEALEERLPERIKGLEIRGGCDQWIRDGDLLIWSEKFTKFKEMYENHKWHPRDGVGDRII